MPHSRRKCAFSGKKKKEQLLLKRQMKEKSSYDVDDDSGEETGTVVEKLMEQPKSRGRSKSNTHNKNLNRFNLQFHQETKKDLDQLNLLTYEPFKTIQPSDREIDLRYFEGYSFPLRPKWHYGMDKNVLDQNENRYFKEYVEQIQKTHLAEEKPLSLFELNLETWRQLWRVLELSDVLVIIVDVRYSTLMFPPTLYTYITETLKKHAILLLNKVDLVNPEVIVAWKHYFNEKFPLLPVVLFASNPPKTGKGMPRSRKWHQRSMEGVYNIYRVCRNFVKPKLDLLSWEEKILEDMREEDFSKACETVEESYPASTNETDQFDFEEHEMFRNGILTIGCVGFPNVGKSSVINAMKGRKVVSVSRTPGHTKHFQTIFLTKNVRLCDCPGLVFPSSTPKYLQVLLGSYPISQLRVPYPSIKYLGEHINLPKLLKLILPEDYDEWSPAAVCDAWAIKRGYVTAKASRPDRYRAANQLLRMCLSGQQNIVLQFYPTGFNEKKDYWLTHEDIESVRKYQDNDEGKSKTECCEEISSINSESEEFLSGTSDDEGDREKAQTNNPFDLLIDT